jgi:D-alanine-D-alanine ligase
MIPKSKLASKLKIVVLAGGISHERDISLKSGRRVADALIEKGAQVIMREPDHELLENLKKDNPDVIWPVLHGASGEDGALREILSLTGIPFVGATGASAKLAWDKSVAKTLVERAGLKSPDSITLPRETFKELDAESVLKLVSKSMTLPVVVKPARSGSAQGVTIVKKQDQLNQAMIDAYVYCDVAIIEDFVDGTELAVGVIDLGSGPVALPAVEIKPRSGHFGFEERYIAGETDYFVPARLTKTVAAKAAKMAVAAHEALGLRHLSRVDMIIDAKGVPWFLEANVLPGLTETSLLPQAILADGSSLGDIYYSLAQAALRGRG